MTTTTLTKQIFRIDIKFHGELDACPSCEHPRSDKTSLECSNCDYHAGAEMAEQWTDFVAALKPPVGEISDTYYDDDCWAEIEFSFDPDSHDLCGQLADLWEWAEEIGGTIDEDHSDGPLFVRDMMWLRLPRALNCGLPRSWSEIDEADLRAMLDGSAVVEVDGGFRALVYTCDGCFYRSEKFATREEAEDDAKEYSESCGQDGDPGVEAVREGDDESVCEWAIEQAAKGETVFSAHDEDGYYFAVAVI